MEKKKVVVLQKRIKDYRVHLFDGVGELYETTIVGYLDPLIKGDNYSTLKLKHKYWPISLDYIFDKELHTLLKDADVVIKSTDFRSINNVILRKAAPKAKIIMYGIGVSASYNEHYDEVDESKQYLKMIEKSGVALPSTDELQQAYDKVSYLDRLRSSIISTTNILIVVAALAILVAMLFLPVLRIYGQSMSSTLHSGDLVVSVKNSSFKTGDVIAFYYNNNILVKRVIATSGQWVDIDLQGNVSVDHNQIDEPYLDEKALGECNIEMPYQVPEGKIFVMGDNRAVSIDSRNTAVGCISEEQIVGKIVFRIWPLNRISMIK